MPSFPHINSDLAARFVFTVAIYEKTSKDKAIMGLVKIIITYFRKIF